MQSTNKLVLLLAIVSFPCVSRATCMLERGDEETQWIDCHIIRYLASTQCVIRVDDTGAIIPIRTVGQPISKERGPLIHPLRPVRARVLLGAFDTEWFSGCTVDADWSTWNKGCFASPTRHQRKRKIADTDKTCFTVDAQQ